MSDGTDARFAALADPTDDSSWGEVVARSAALSGPRRPRPLVAIAAALALAVVIAAPAVGLRSKIVRLFSDAAPAPQRIVKSFTALGGGAAPPGGVGVEAGRALKVLETPVAPRVRAILWLAPTTGGGFCTLLDLEGKGGGADCLQLRYDRLSVTVSLHGRISPAGKVLSGPVLLDGFAGQKRADSLVLGFQDGETARIPLVWVSAPVDAGFFVYGVPAQHWRAGHLPTTLTLLAANGDELDHREIHGIPIPGSLSGPGNPG
jgi:hypothetical protein